MDTRRIAGIETEYAIMPGGTPESDSFIASEHLLQAYPVVYQDHPLAYSQAISQAASEISLNDVLALLQKEAQEEISSLSILLPDTLDFMLVNGARFYIDHGHPEYSTPECLSPAALVAADKAGERIIETCEHWLNAGEGTLSRGQSILLYKNNSDYKNNSYGCHENYLLKAALFEDLLYHRTQRVLQQFLPFLITRTMLCGSGKVGAENGGAAAGFQLSQRVDFFETLTGLQTTYKRPLFNTRDEPHADPRQYRRLHVILGDANMAEVSTYLKVGTTQLVLRMLEDNFIQHDLALVDPLNCIQTISRDLNFRALFRLVDGRMMTALDIQYIYLEMATRYLEQSEGGEDAWTLLEMWEDTLSCLSQDWSKLATRLDWAIKRRLFEQLLNAASTTWDEVAVWQVVLETPGGLPAMREKSRQLGLAWSDFDRQRDLYFQLRKMDLQYHDIRSHAASGEMGLFYHLQQRGAIERIVTDQEIQERISSPPGDTRAGVRGRCISLFSEAAVSADWSSLHIQLADKEFQLRLCDPLATLPLEGGA